MCSKYLAVGEGEPGAEGVTEALAPVLALEQPDAPRITPAHAINPHATRRSWRKEFMTDDPRSIPTSLKNEAEVYGRA
jgi:hypothetical protein